MGKKQKPAKPIILPYKAPAPIRTAEPFPIDPFWGPIGAAYSRAFKARADAAEARGDTEAAETARMYQYMYAGLRREVR